MTGTTPRFRIAIHRAKGSYFAQVLDLPGCIARGATEVEAVENARSAIRAYLLIAQALAGDRATVQLEISA
jgi:predicted RNase H-like HicB family nuclease